MFKFTFFFGLVNFRHTHNNDTIPGWCSTIVKFIIWELNATAKFEADCRVIIWKKRTSNIAASRSNNSEILNSKVCQFASRSSKIWIFGSDECWWWSDLTNFFCDKRLSQRISQKKWIPPKRNKYFGESEARCWDKIRNLITSELDHPLCYWDGIMEPLDWICWT